MSERFKIVEVNPNDTCGGGGCVCSEEKLPECKGPYAVFFHTDMESGRSPNVVISEHCLRAALDVIDIGEPLAGGETGEVENPYLTSASVKPAELNEFAHEVEVGAQKLIEESILDEADVPEV